MYGQWYDLNSLSGLPETLAVPCTVSDFFLNAQLGTLKEQGYSIFAVTGKYPPLHPRSELVELEQQTKFNGKMVYTIKVYKATELKSRDKTYPKNLLNDVNRSNIGQSVGVGAHGGSEEYMLQQAMAASLQDNNFGGGGMGGMGNMGNAANGYGNFGTGNEDSQLQKALAMSMMSSANDNKNGNNVNNSNKEKEKDKEKSKNGGDNDEEMDEAAEMEKAMFMSMQGEYAEKVPKEPEKNDANKIDIQLMLINGQKVQRSFLKTHTLEDVSNYVKSIVKLSIKIVMYNFK